MDWIEKLFGFSPDGGSGATEILISLAVVSVPIALYLHRMIRGEKRHGKSNP